MNQTTKKLAAIGLIVYAGNASAEVILEQAAEVSLGTTYNTNLQLLQDQDKESVWLYNIVPKYKITASDGVNEWFGIASLNVERSSNKDVSDDREDPSIDLGWKHELERGTLGLKASYIKASTRQTQFTDTGVLLQDGSSIEKSIVANWSHLITTNLNYAADLGYEKTSFSGVNVLNNYSLTYLNNVLSYKYNEMVSPYLGVRLNDYKSQGDLGSSRIKYQDYLVGAELELSPTIKLNVGTGFTNFSSSGQDNEWIGLVDASYTGERYTLTSRLERSVLPTGLGDIEIGDRFSLGYGYDLTEKSGFGIDLTLGKNKSLTSIETQQLGAYYNRELSASWVMRLTYEFRNLKAQGIDSVSGNAAGIVFTYRTPKF